VQKLEVALELVALALAAGLVLSAKARRRPASGPQSRRTAHL
jgi:hypothetical protein